MEHQKLLLRWPSMCADCGDTLEARTLAWWSRAAREARCVNCFETTVTLPELETAQSAGPAAGGR